MSRLLSSSRSLAMAIILLIPATSPEAANRPFRHPGADYNSPLYISNEAMAHGRSQFLRALEARLATRQQLPNTSGLDIELFQQARDRVVHHALSLRALLDGIGPESVASAQTYATVIMRSFVDSSHTMIGSSRWETGHTQALAALAMTDEYLNILQLLRVHIAEAGVDFQRLRLNSGLDHIKTIIGNIITSPHYNGLVTLALLDLWAQIINLLNPQFSDTSSIDYLRDLRSRIGKVFLAHSIIAPYPAPPLDPEKLINPALKVTPSHQQACYQWPWPVQDISGANSTRNYLICVEAKSSD
ncbi:hypothetical protein [Parendozoicomonas haliclonae]|nr:hypothetical protein [Parendozoicomonas haliclonae]